MEAKPLVLILCTGNSCRSHLAEGILRAAAGDAIRVASAGSKPAGYVHPLAINAMQEIGIDISAHRSKHLSEFLDQPVETLITVCGNADQACPMSPGQVNRYHWGFDDPAHATGSEEESWMCSEECGMRSGAYSRRMRRVGGTSNCEGVRRLIRGRRDGSSKTAKRRNGEAGKRGSGLARRSAKGASTSQPRATPWVKRVNRPSPERALHGGVTRSVCPALAGLVFRWMHSQGVALGWLVKGLWPAKAGPSRR